MSRRVVEILADYRPVLDEAQRLHAAGDMSALDRFRGTSLRPCQEDGCCTAAVLTGTLDREALIELIAEHGWDTRNGPFGCAKHGPPVVAG